MKKTLSLILSFVMLVTSIVCIFTNGFVASAAVGYSEDFESYTVGTDMAADDALAWKVYDEGEKEYYKGTVGSNGWMANGKTTLLVSDTKATTSGGKAMAVPSWGVAFKEVAVQPGNIYTLTFKFNADAVNWKDFGVYDVSNVTADGYSLKAYTAFEGSKAYNRIQLYDKTLLSTLAWDRNKNYTANTWTEYTATFTTTEGMSKVLLSFAYEGSGAMYIDDISLTYVTDTEATAIFKDGSFEIATAANPSKTISHKEQSLRVHSYKNNKQPIMENGWVGSHYGSANVVLANTTYTPSSGSFTTPAAQDGVQMIHLSTVWQTVAKVVNVEAGTDYALSYWYYTDNASAGFMSDMDFAIGLDANATTVTIPVTKWEADGVTIKDCGGDILADGTDGQTKIAYTPKSGDNKNVVGAWTKRTLYFNSGTFTKIAIPFYFKEHNVYIDNVSITENKDIKINVEITGKDNKNAGTANVVLTENNTFEYSAKAFKNAEFLGWFDGDTLYNSAPSFELEYAQGKSLTAKFKVLYKNEVVGGYVDDLSLGANVAEGYDVTSSSVQVNGAWKYTFTSTPATNGWFFSIKNKSATVVEKATDTVLTNKAIEIKAWDKVAKIIDVQPNHKYTLTYDYFLPTNTEFGNFNIYDASGVTDNKYVGRSDTAPSGVFSNELMWSDSSITSLPPIGSNFLRLSGKSGAESHEKWITRTLSFETGADITRILLTWAPEGTGYLYLDNIELTSKLIPEVKVTITGADNKNAGGAQAVLNDAGDEITFIATAYKNSVFKGWYRKNQLVSADAVYKEAYNGSYEILEARFECAYVNEFTGDSGFENTPFNENLLTGLKVTSSSQQVNGVWKYKFEANPNANGYLSQVSTSTALVVEQANAFNPNNKALAVSQWSRFGRVIEVKPNHKYTFTYDYYLPNGAKLGDFNIYNVSSVNNNTYIGRDDIYEAGITVTENNTFLFRDSENNKFPELGNNYFRGADKAADYTDAAGNPVDSHENWITRTATFETDANTTKILIAFKPEGNKPLILDNLTLTGLFVPDVDVTITGEDDPTSASAYAVVNDAKTEIKFVAKNFPNSEFVGWYRNNQLVSTNAIYTESFNGDAASYQKMEARFNCKYINEFKDGFVDTLETGINIVNGQVVTKLDEESYYNAQNQLRWRYNRKSKPNAAGWMASENVNVPVTELTDGNGDINKVIQISSWQHVAKVIDVKPNHKYTFSFDYYLPNGTEFGHFNILNVSSATNNEYVGTWDVNCPYEATSLRKQYAWFDTNYNVFTEMGNNYYKSIAKQDSGTPGEAGYVDSHETWITKTCTFETDANTNKILIAFAPEGSGYMYLDNFTLTSEFVPYVNVVTTGKDDKNAGGASARYNENKDAIIFSAETYANGKFLGWYKNNSLVSNEAVYTEAFSGSADNYAPVEARFEALYKNEFTGDSGFGNTNLNTNLAQGSTATLISQGLKPDGVNYYYMSESVPNAQGWMVHQNVYQPVVNEFATDNNKYNRALKLSPWGNYARVIEVKPNHKYTFTFDFYLPETAEFGNFNIYDASSVTNNTFIGRNDAIITYTDRQMWANSSNDLLPALGNNFYRSSAKSDALNDDGMVIDNTHDVWRTRTATFFTGDDVTKIVICWRPEGAESIYLDNLSLVSEFVPPVKVTSTNDELGVAGGANARLNDAADKIIYTATAYKNGTFLGWYRNNTLVSSAYSFTENYSGNYLDYEIVEARFQPSFKNEFLGDSGFESIMDGENLVAGATSVEQPNSKYVVVTSYDTKADEQGKAKAQADVDALNAKGYTSKLIVSGNVAIAAIKATSEDEGYKAGEEVLGNKPCDAINGSRIVKVKAAMITAYNLTNTSAQSMAETDVANLKAAGIEASVEKKTFGENQYFVVVINTTEEAKVTAAREALNNKTSDLADLDITAITLQFVVVSTYEQSEANAEAKAQADYDILKDKYQTLMLDQGGSYVVVVRNTGGSIANDARVAIGNKPCVRADRYLYVYHSTPNKDNWVQQLTPTVEVVEKANATNEFNRTAQVPLWGKIARVVDVKPNSNYTFNFDYFMSMYVEFGSVVIYDVSGITNNTYIGRDDVAADLDTEYKFKGTDGKKLRILSSWRSAGTAGANDKEIHDKWCSKELTFSTSLTTNKILIVFAPEGNTNASTKNEDGTFKPVPSDKNLYLDNFVLKGKELDHPITPKPLEDQGEMGNVYPDTGYIPVGQTEAELTFMASPVAGYKFVKWQLNGVDVAGEEGTNPVYKGVFNKTTKLTPVFEEIGAGNIVANSGYEKYENGTKMLDNKNDPTIPGSWFAVWSSDGSDGNGYSQKYLEVKEDGTPQNPQKFWTTVTVSNEEARSGNNSVKFERMSYQILGRDITGLQKNTRYLLSFWVKFNSESSYMSFVSVTPKSIKDEMWKDGECNSSDLNTYGVGGKNIATLNTTEKTLNLNGEAQGWQKISIAFNTKDETGVALTMQMIDPKGKATALFVDDIGIEAIGDSTKLVNATATYDIGGKAQTSAGNGFVKAGEQTMFYAIPQSGITFESWYEVGTTTNPVSDDRFYVVNLDKDLSYVARFNAIEVGLQSYQLGGFATVDKTGVYPDGTEVTFTAEVYEGNTFAGWFDANTDKLVSKDLVYRDTHDDSIILIAKFDGYNKPAREVLGLNGFENYPVDTELKETWLDDIVDYQIYANGSTDNSWTKFTVKDWRAYEGDKALYCSNRWRFTRLELTGLNKNTTYKISFKYHMAEEDESAKMYTYVGPTGVQVPDESQSKDLMYIYDETGVAGGRGWDTYELYFNSGELSTLEFGIKFEASNPSFSGAEAYKNTMGYDQANMYIDNLELWEYSSNDEIVSSSFNGENSAWISEGNKATFDNGVANIPANSTTYQSVKVTPFTQYLLTFEAQASDLLAGVIGVDYTTVNSISQISSISAANVKNTAMNKYTVAFTTGNEEMVSVAFTNNGSSVAKVDNVALTVDTVGYSEGVIEKVDFESERFAINNFSINDPNKEHILKCEYEYPFQNEGFEIYTAKSGSDKNVLNGEKSLKILPQADEEVAHKLWQTWMNFPTAKLNGNYLISFNYKFDSANGGSLYLAGDAKDLYVQEHTIIAQDNKWHTAYFSIDNTEGLIFLKAAIGTIAGNAGSAVYIDDVTFQLHPSMITEATTRYTYTENLYNRVENNNFEDKITSADWSGMPKEFKIVTGDAFTEEKYLQAGVSSKVYTKVVEVDPSQAYYVGVSLRGANGTKGKLSLMSTNLSGNNVLFTDADKTVNSTFTYKGSGEWERYGFKFVTPSNGKLSIVIDTRNGAIDIDNIMIFPIKFKYTYDPNDYYDYKPYDFSDMSNAIINGGIGDQPYYDGNLNVGRDKDPYEAKGNVLIYNPTYTNNTVVNVIVLTLSMLAALAAVAYLIVKNKKKEVK